LKKKMGDLLTTDEISAANHRLLQVQKHLTTLRDKNRVLNNLDDWSREDVTRLLTAKRDGQNTSYFARDLEITNVWRQRGLVIPYPK
jgi:hypothetical protein